MRMGNDIKSEYLPKKVCKVYYESFMSGLANRMRAWITTSAFAEYLNVSYTMSWKPDDACGKKHFTDLFEVPDNMNLVEHKEFEIDDFPFKYSLSDLVSASLDKFTAKNLDETANKTDELNGFIKHNRIANAVYTRFLSSHYGKFIPNKALS